MTQKEHPVHWIHWTNRESSADQAEGGLVVPGNGLRPHPATGEECAVVALDVSEALACGVDPLGVGYVVGTGGAYRVDEVVAG